MWYNQNKMIGENYMLIKINTDHYNKEEVFIDDICPNCSKPTNPQLVSQGCN